MTIKRGGLARITSETFTDRVRYCPRCESAGIRNQETILGKRIYTKEEFETYESSWHGKLPPDAKLWLQCRKCNLQIKRSDAIMEGELFSEIELGSPNIHALKKRNLKQHARDRLSIENLDPELKRELKGGSKLISYSKR